ncbi:hypothetical protein [Anaerostipes sp. Marseille-Q3525]|nr:hypothetical protein [Anaerostipes sp. Marseille-Q3525]
MKKKKMKKKMRKLSKRVAVLEKRVDEIKDSMNNTGKKLVR